MTISTMNHELQLILLLAILIAASKLSGHLVRRYLKQPVVFGELLAGVILGPTFACLHLSVLAWPMLRGSADWLHEMVNMLGAIGVLLLMFIAGMETRPAELRRVGKTAFTAASLGVLFPLGIGMLAARLFGLPVNEALFIGVVLTATSVSITAQTLIEMNQLYSKEGVTILGAAVIDDVLGIIILSFVIAFGAAGAVARVGIAQGMSAWLAGSLGMPGSVKYWHIALTLLLMAAYFGLAYLAGKRAVPKMLAAAKHLHASFAVPTAALVLLFIFAFAAEYVGQVAAITGAYLAGLFLARTPYAKQIEHAIHPFTYAFFVPLFLMSIGLGTNMGLLAREQWLFTAVIILVAVLTKIIGCGLGSYLTGFSLHESLRVGAGMISRGEVGLIVALVGLNAGLIHPQIYAALIIMILLTTMITPLLLRMTFPHEKEVECDVFESVANLESAEEETEYE